jgi:hypothetical protein
MAMVNDIVIFPGEETTIGHRSCFGGFCMNKKNVTRNVWSYKNADFISLNEEINEYDWEIFLNSSIDVDDMSERFTHKYLEMMRKHIYELVDSIAKTDSKACWSLIKKLTKGSNNNYSIPPLFDNNLKRFGIQ